jgi:hypothetical protein
VVTAWVGYRIPLPDVKERDAMRTSLTAVATAAVLTTLAGASAAGCSTHPNSSPPSPGSASKTSAPTDDYTKLLIKAADIKAPDTFTAGPVTKNPNGQSGATVTFSDQDHSHTIIDTIAVTLNPQAAASALDSAKSIHREALRTKALNAEVGVGGVTIEGLSEDRSKGVTVLLFTEGKALVTLEFDGPPEMLAPIDFVTEVGQKQDDVVKKGLGG